MRYSTFFGCESQKPWKLFFNDKQCTIYNNDSRKTMLKLSLKTLLHCFIALNRLGYKCRQEEQQSLIKSHDKVVTGGTGRMNSLD